MRLDALLTPDWVDFVASARIATLTTLDADGTPAAVPICFVVVEGAIYSPIDEKPKRNVDARALRRVRNLERDSRAGLLVQHWDEDWTRLAFLDLVTDGRMLEPGPADHAAAVAALRGKYPQYATHRLEERPILRLEPTSVNGRWAASEGVVRRSP